MSGFHLSRSAWSGILDTGWKEDGPRVKPDDLRQNDPSQASSGDNEPSQLEVRRNRFQVKLHTEWASDGLSSPEDEDPLLGPPPSQGPTATVQQVLEVEAPRVPPISTALGIPGHWWARGRRILSRVGRGDGPVATLEQVLAASEPITSEPVKRRLPPRWVMASLVIHALVAIGLYRSVPLEKSLPPELESLEVVEIDPSMLSPEMLATLPEEQPIEPASKPPPPTSLPRGQVVNLPPPDRLELPPEQSKYLAADNHRVEKETQAREVKPNPEVVASRFSKEMHASGQRGIEEQGDGAEARESRKIAMLPTPSARSSQAPMPDSTRERAVSDVGDEALAPDERPRPDSSKINLFPSYSQMAQLKGRGTGEGLRMGDDGPRSGAPDNHALDEALGDETRLNARKFAYSKFYNALRRQFNYFYMQSSDNLRSSDIDQRLFQKQYVTRFMVVLAADGRVADVKITQSAGVAAFDGVVLEALKNASPFPSPPSELLEDGRLVVGGECRLGVGMGMPSFNPLARER